MSEMTEDSDIMRKKLKNWRETGIKTTFEILKRLKENLSIEQIKETKISKIVARISKENAENDEEKKLIDECIDIVEFWKAKYKKFKEEEKKKELVVAETINKNKNEEKETEVSKKKKEPLKEKQIIKSKTIENNNKIEKNIDFNNDGMPSDPARQKICKVFLNQLEIESKKYTNLLNSDEVRSLSYHIEKALYEKHKTNNKDYYEDVRMIMANLKDQKNPELCEKVLDGRVSAEDLVSLRPNILESEKMKKSSSIIIDNSIQATNLNWQRDQMLKEQKGGGVKCINAKCGSDKTTTVLVQIRRADEGMTEFNECAVCGKRWKF